MTFDTCCWPNGDNLYVTSHSSAPLMYNPLFIHEAILVADMYLIPGTTSQRPCFRRWGTSGVV
jgi:hypothetical protein